MIIGKEAELLKELILLWTDLRSMIFKHSDFKKLLNRIRQESDLYAFEEIRQGIDDYLMVTDKKFDSLDLLYGINAVVTQILHRLAIMKMPIPFSGEYQVICLHYLGEKAAYEVYLCKGDGNNKDLLGCVRSIAALKPYLARSVNPGYNAVAEAPAAMLPTYDLMVKFEQLQNR